MFGGVSMREAQVYIENIKNRKKYIESGGVVSQLGGLYPPPSHTHTLEGRVKRSLVGIPCAFELVLNFGHNYHRQHSLSTVTVHCTHSQSIVFTVYRHWEKSYTDTPPWLSV